MFRALYTTAILFSLAIPALADAPVQCNFPDPGRWMLNMGQTGTNMGPGGGPQSLPFDLVVEGCGETIITYGFGGPMGGNEKRFNRTSEDTYVFQTTYRGIPVGVTLGMETSRLMKGEWVFGTFARAPGDAEFLGLANLAEVPPLCNCEAFRQRLRDAIESDEYWISVYSDPRFGTRPDGLDPAIEWTIVAQEQLIDLVTDQSAPVAYDEAVSGFAEHTKPPSATEGAAGNTAEQSGGHGPTRSDGATAITDARTCDNEILHHATGCASDILDGATQAHEDHHSDTCEPFRIEALRTALSANPTPNYSEVIFRNTALNAQNEVEAYEIGIAYIRDSFLAMCKTPLN